MKRSERESLARVLQGAGEAMQAGLTAGESAAIVLADEGDSLPKSIRESLAGGKGEGDEPAFALARVVGVNCDAWIRGVPGSRRRGRALVAIAAALPRSHRPPAAYTLIIADVAVLMVLSLVVGAFIAPTWNELFSAMGAELPAPTRLAITVAKLMIPVSAILLVTGVVAGVWMKRAPWLGVLAEGIDRLLLRMPVVGTWLRIRLTAGVANWLALETGRSLAALDALSEAGHGSYGGRAAARIAAMLRAGKPLPDALENSGAILPGMTALLRRRTSAVEGDFAPDALELYALNTARREGPSLEKLMLAAHFVTGLMVGAYVVALYLPIFKMGAAV